MSFLARNIDIAAASDHLDYIYADLLGDTPDIASLWVVGQAWRSVWKASVLKTSCPANKLAVRRVVKSKLMEKRRPTFPGMLKHW